MLFPAAMFSFSVGTVGKIYPVYGKYSLKNFHTCHSKISSARQGGELVGANISFKFTEIDLYWHPLILK